MPLPIKISASISKYISKLLLSSKTKKPKTQPKKTGRTPSKTSTKRRSLTVSAPTSSKTKKTGGSPSKTISSLSSLNTKKSKSPPKNSQQNTFASIPDDVLSSYVYNKLNVKGIARMNSLNKSFQSKKIKYDLVKVDLSHVTINKKIIDFLNSHLNKEEVKKLKLQNIKFEDQESFNAFINILESFENIEELEIDGFWSEQYKYKKTNRHYNEFLILIIKKIRLLKKLKKLTIINIDIEEETIQDISNINTEEDVNNYEKNLFRTVFIDTLNQLTKLKYLIFENNVISRDTIFAISSWHNYLKDREIIFKNSKNITKMEETGH